MKCNVITKSTWQNATNLSSELFREADRLNSLAYALLPDAANSPEAAQLFHEAKNSANAKYVEAKGAWDAARQQLKKIYAR